MVREEQLLKRIQELETENEKLRTQLNRRTSGAVDGAAEQTRAKYADRILDTLPDMMTVWTNSGVITDLISSEETNHVGVPSERFIGMNIRELLPEEAYRNVRANLDHVLETKRGSTGRHDLTVDGDSGITKTGSGRSTGTKCCVCAGISPRRCVPKRR